MSADPANKAKSVVVTNEGLQKAEELFKALRAGSANLDSRISGVSA
jgi:hypothetical protein